jgi:hypothetical protein
MIIIITIIIITIIIIIIIITHFPYFTAVQLVLNTVLVSLTKHLLFSHPPKTCLIYGMFLLLLLLLLLLLCSASQRQTAILNYEISTTWAM